MKKEKDWASPRERFDMQQRSWFGLPKWFREIGRPRRVIRLDQVEARRRHQIVAGVLRATTRGVVVLK